MKNIKLFIIFSLLTLSVLGQNAQELFQKGNKAYNNKDYQSAINYYQKTIELKQESSLLYYNLGNAYYRTNDISSAILYYEKALKLDPNNEDIIFNLKFANSKIVDRIEAMPKLFYQRWWNTLCSAMSFNNWGILCIISFTLALTGILIYLFSQMLSSRKIGFWGSLTALFISILCFSCGYTQYNSRYSEKEAIVFSYSTSAKASPDINSSDLFVIHEGIKVKITDQINDWYEIRLANGSKGWIKQSELKLI